MQPFSFSQGEDQIAIITDINYSYAQEVATSNDVSEGFLTVECDGIDLGCYFANGVLYFFHLVWYSTTQVLAFIAGFTLDVLLFHSISSATYRTGLIEAGWEILRNLTNIVFIFSLLFIAFKMVLSGSSSIKKVLIKTILVALVINFSLYMSYVIIDSSNILANIFYQRIEIDNQSRTTNEFINTFFSAQTMKSPSAALVSKFEPQAIITKAGPDLNTTQRFLVVFSAGGINILMISIFLSIILLFLGRTVGLMLSVILAPLAFVTLAIPTSDMSNIKWIGFNSWLKQLITLSFMAPVYLFFLYLIIIFANNDALFNSINIAGNTGTGSTNVINIILGVILPFSLIAILLTTAKKITTDMAGDLGGRISEYASKGLTGAAAVGLGAATMGIAATGGAARLLGKGASKIGMEGAGKFLEGAGKWGQTAKFDASKIPGFENTFGKNTFASKVAKGIGSTSYSDIDTGVRGAANKVRSGISDFNTGRTPESVAQWEKNVQDSRNANTQRRADNQARVASDDAKTERNKIAINTDPFGTITYMPEGARVQDKLEEYRQKRAEMDEAAVKREKKDIDDAKAILEAEIQVLQKESKGSTNPAEIATKKQAIADKKKKIEQIEQTSTEGVIKQLEKVISTAETNAKAQMFIDDNYNRNNTQDSNFTMSGDRRRERVRKQASEYVKNGGNNSKDKK